jgi:hypothetical protein
VCRPDQAADPCISNLAAFGAGVAVRLLLRPPDGQPRHHRLAVTHVDRVTAVEQVAPLATVCAVWAPAYRSQTWTSVEKGLAGDEAVMRATFTVAYDSVLPAWLWFILRSVPADFLQCPADPPLGHG